MSVISRNSQNGFLTGMAQLLESNILHYGNFGELINNLEKMAKKPAIDDELSKVLDSFMIKLQESERYLSHGILKTDFSEAALLLQNASVVYGKKVDLLWDCILDYQDRIISYEDHEKNKDERSKLEERINRFKKRKKKNNVEHSISALEKAKKLLDMAKNIEPNVPSDLNFLKKPQLEWLKELSNKSVDPLHSCFYYWNHPNLFYSLKNPHLLKMGDSKFLDEDMQYVNKYEFELSYYFNKLQGEIEFLAEVCDPEVLNTQISQSELIKDFMKEKNLTKKDFEENLKLETEFFKYAEKRNAVYLENQKNKLKKIGAGCFSPGNDSGIFDESINELNETRSESQSLNSILNVQFTKNCSVNLERLSKSCLEYYIEKSLQEELSKESIDNDVIKNCMNCSADLGICEDLLSENPEQNRSKEQQNHSIIESFMMPFFHDIKPKENIILKRNHENDTKKDIKNKVPSKRIKMRKSFTVRLKKFENFFNKIKVRITEKGEILESRIVKLKYFENFFNKNFVTEDDEGEIIQENDYSESDSETESEISNDNFITYDSYIENNNNIDVLQTNNVISENNLNNIISTENSETERIEETGNTETNELRKNNETFANPINEILRGIQDKQKKYFEWKNFIENKLKNTEEKDFDIHKYEENIIEAFKENKFINFDEVVVGKGSSEATKYFIASLQLANTYNIELSVENGGFLANGQIEMKLLSVDRHHEHLKDYQAPSEVTYYSKLAEVEALERDTSFVSSTPKVEFVGHKKPNSNKYKRRKIIICEDKF